MFFQSIRSKLIAMIFIFIVSLIGLISLLNYNIQEAEGYSVELSYNPENAKYRIKLNIGSNFEPVPITANIIKK